MGIRNVVETPPTTALADDEIRRLYSLVNEQSYRSVGAGNHAASYQTILSQFDRYGANTLPPNHEVAGYTFITRPKLNLSTTSLRQDRVLSILDSADPGSLLFAIRCYLDTNYANRKDVSPLSLLCPFFNKASPFLIPLSNNLVSVAGWPDPVLETETTTGGFFSEDFTMVKGSDRLSRTYDITLTFRDIQGGFIIFLLYFWLRFIELVVRGDTVAYPEDVAARRICYTCSIYRFVMDPSRRFITKWAKATGCFPRTVPIGNFLNFGERENFIHSAMQYSIPFTANKVEIMDPIIFRDFNTIIKRFSGYNDVTIRTLREAGTDPSENFIGIPYIDIFQGFNELKWLAPVAAFEDRYTDALEELKRRLIGS